MDQDTHTLTIDEAVAGMVGLDYVPPGCTVLELTDAFLEEATVSLDNFVAGDAEYTKDWLQARVQACTHRHQLALALGESIKAELKRGVSASLAVVGGSSMTPRIAVQSLAHWAEHFYGISVPAWTPTPVTESSRNASGTASSTPSAPPLVWTDTVFAIHQHYRLRWNVGPKESRSTTFSECGLMGTRKLEPNHLGLILLGFSKQGIRAYPPGPGIEGKHKTAISKLRAILRDLTGIEADPFYAPNDDMGWRPRFTVVDRREASAQEAQDKAHHVSFADDRPYEQEDDEADEFLRGHPER